MQIVLDTNILVSSLISKGTPPYQLQQAWQAGSFVLITSRAQLEEVKRVFGYEKLKKFITPREREELLASIEADAVIIEPVVGVSFSPDVSDNLIIATAIAGRASYLVTGDKRDLLALKRVQGIAIITARQAIDILEKHHG